MLAVPRGSILHQVYASPGVHPRKLFAVAPDKGHSLMVLSHELHMNSGNKSRAMSYMCEVRQ